VSPYTLPTIQTLEKDIESINERLDRLHVWTEKQEGRIQDIDKDQGIAREAARNTRSMIIDANKDLKSLALIVDDVIKEESWKMMKLITWTIGLITGFLGICFVVLKMAGIL